MRRSAVPLYRSTNAGSHLSLLNVPGALRCPDLGIRAFRFGIIPMGTGWPCAISVIQVRSAGILFNLREHNYYAGGCAQGPSASHGREP